MRRILVVEASPRAESVSRRAAAVLLDRLRGLYPEAAFLRRDLAREPPPPIDAAFDRAMRLPETERSAADRAALAASEALIGELETTDGLVIATPMHNYTVPAALKTWIDQVVRPRRSFGFGPNGKFGLLADRPCFLITAAGGRHGGAGEQPDFLVPYLRAILGTIGIHDVQALPLQGTTRGGPDPMAEVAPWLDRVLPPLGAPQAI